MHTLSLLYIWQTPPLSKPWCEYQLSGPLIEQNVSQAVLLPLFPLQGSNTFPQV